MSRWRRSSRSAPEQGNCVEARTMASRFELRDSKLGESSEILDMTKADWRGFLNLVRR
ncbi:DUF397 domain-containing protein [Stackebrandtia nassauensis]|uniref:DUF397 domain-containing protein n=1 Tax=Stackebrandtia nassauensis (strain DSM 44728 / CIP 108903 / NRRL B-16338 / NBRC 102104 / LLR-40K-21) TaxID=446470 RepID=D3Q0Q0_STANL|nr:DUF397 domain-containing protein [Stackebrandtia nassauensis]ADD41786.1 hypothetical protein Snas_2092 [Stackebrandtia nassauensis DSM 44728]